MTNKKTERDAGLEVGEDQVVERTPGSDEEAVAPEPAESGDGSAEVEAASGASDELTQELEELRDRHLRLAAEFDNFRKRTTRELQQSGVRAQADLVERLLDPLDDLGRVAHLEAADAKAEDVI
ncbi:MAG: nucleotide exchange factor GrpE, partial [Gammaproteobacteria bacterium]|nr:nucleotide exchange factor GrpE [Gammaproteobacteria bacterium]